MTVYIGLLLFLLLKYFDCAMIKHNKGFMTNLPQVLSKEVLEFANDEGIAAMRVTSRSNKSEIEEYLKRRRLRAMLKNRLSALCRKLSVMKLWQLSCLMDSRDFTINDVVSRVYKPYSCKNHMKLLRFLSTYPEFSEYFARLKRDRRGFIEPMKRLYGSRIHGLEEFMSVMGLEMEEASAGEGGVNGNDDVCDSEDMGIFFVMMKLMKCMG